MAGCRHPHEEDDPATLVMCAEVPAVRGSRMRRGGVFTDPQTGLTLGTDHWLKVRCNFCGSEAMTPVELVPPFALPNPDGSVVSHCGACAADMEAGRHPGETRRRHRRRRH